MDPHRVREGVGAKKDSVNNLEPERTLTVKLYGISSVEGRDRVRWKHKGHFSDFPPVPPGCTLVTHESTLTTCKVESQVSTVGCSRTES